MSWITVKVVKTRGAEEFWFCAELELAAESRGLHAAREAMAVAELAPSKASADLRVIVELRCATPVRVALGEHAGAEVRTELVDCVVPVKYARKPSGARAERCFIATSFQKKSKGTKGFSLYCMLVS